VPFQQVVATTGSYIVTTYKTTNPHEREKEIKEIK